MSDLDHAFLTVYSADGIGMNVMSVAVKRLSKYVQIIIQFFRAEVLRGVRQYGFYFRRGQCCDDADTQQAFCDFTEKVSAFHV